jgi:hypothetical protein
MPIADFIARLRPIALCSLAAFLAVVSTAVAQTTTFSILHTFKGSPGDGADPIGALFIDGAGNLYGTTEWGGSNNQASCAGGGSFLAGCGTVFELPPFNSGIIFPPGNIVCCTTSLATAPPAVTIIIRRVTAVLRLPA